MDFLKQMLNSTGNQGTTTEDAAQTQSSQTNPTQQQQIIDMMSQAVGLVMSKSQNGVIGDMDGDGDRDLQDLVAGATALMSKNSSDTARPTQGSNPVSLLTGLMNQAKTSGIAIPPELMNQAENIIMQNQSR